MMKQTQNTPSTNTGKKHRGLVLVVGLIALATLGHLSYTLTQKQKDNKIENLDI